MFEALKALQTEKEAYEAKMKEAGEKAVREAVREFMTAHPEVKKLKWTQYTPYFNDGDPCTFSVRGVYVNIGGREGGEDDDGFLSEYELEDGPLKASLAEFETAIHSMDDALQLAFGDHAEVICTPKQIKVESYDHD